MRWRPTTGAPAGAGGTPRVPPPAAPPPRALACPRVLETRWAAPAGRSGEDRVKPPVTKRRRGASLLPGGEGDALAARVGVARQDGAARFVLIDRQDAGHVRVADAVP